MPINIISEIQAGTLPDINTTQLFLMDVERFLDALPREPLFDLVVTSPPYNIGKEYENQIPLADYVAWQKGSSKRYILGSKIMAAYVGKLEIMLKMAVLHRLILSLPRFLRN